ncbi:MAG: 50S ribosomal protein L4 [SAR324 cluster bacterium]|nr:50S ribosomal protein L4 [SAR324 cluster bacterium]
MAKLQVLHLDSKAAGELELSDQFLGTEYHPYIVKDAVVQYRAGLRQGTHSTKTRKEVNGTTRKPWKQKGTGRARVGTTKSPLWRHGGIVFGPHPRDYSIQINKKVKRKALRSALAEKIRLQQIVIVESMDLETHKTKSFSEKLKQLGCASALIVVDNISPNLELASRNMPDVHVISQRSLGIYEVLRFEKVVFEKSALAAVEQRLLS